MKRRGKEFFSVPHKFFKIFPLVCFDNDKFLFDFVLLFLEMGPSSPLFTQFNHTIPFRFKPQPKDHPPHTIGKVYKLGRFGL